MKRRMTENLTMIIKERTESYRKMNTLDSISSIYALPLKRTARWRYEIRRLLDATRLRLRLAARRGDYKRMLATPPKPHSDMKIGKPKAKSGKSQRPKT